MLPRKSRRMAVILLTTILLLTVSLATTLTFVYSDNTASYLLPMLGKVKQYHEYLQSKLSELTGVGPAPANETLADAEMSYDKKPVYEDDREDATMFSLVRNEELDQMLASILHVETRFNHQFHYDWVFANDQPFTEEFKTLVRDAVSGRSIFTEVPHEFWSYPEWIDQDRLLLARKILQKLKIKYGGSESYRHMCRFNSGFFYKLPVLEPYTYYWRVEPNVKFVCDINYDPFKVMRTQGKKYGFNMAMREFPKTIETLWASSTEFFAQNSQLVLPDNNMRFISQDEGKTYNLCHFWSNFEIASLDFFRSAEYNKYFDHLDRLGGFFYERWGDAPVHTILVSQMLPLSELHYFDNTGYYHEPNLNCPPQLDVRSELNCDCNPIRDFTWHKWSCVSNFFLANELELPQGVKPNHSKRDELELGGFDELDEYEREALERGAFN